MAGQHNRLVHEGVPTQGDRWLATIQRSGVLELYQRLWCIVNMPVQVRLLSVQ
jgi:hypothetical protein